MAEKRQQSAQQSAEQGIISTIFLRLVQGLVFILLTLFFSIVIEWAGMATDFWEQPGAQHSAVMLEQELRYLNDDFKQSVLVEKPIDFAKTCAEQFYHYIFEVTGIKSMFRWLATPVSSEHQAFRYRLHGYYRLFLDYIQALVTVIQIFAVRLAVLTLALPAFILLSMTGLIDGLVQRDVRRWSAGRESSFVYHWAKRMLTPSLIHSFLIKNSLAIA
jgi:integrating conjugative element membrane protein (TIGR03747 family)